MWRSADLALRFIYVLAAPVVLVPFAAIVPLGGVLIGVGVATVIALSGSERWRARTERIPVVGRFLSNLANLGDYYDDHPPKPLLYYVVYPLLAPYWLFVRDARREFLLYRRLNAIALAIIVGLGIREYLVYWRPDIPFAAFLNNTIAMFVVQLLVTFALVMPIVTTIVAYHRRGKRRTLTALLVLTGLLGLIMTIAVVSRDRPSPVTATRLRLRGAADLPRTTAVLTRALELADAELAAKGPPVKARDELETLWRADEARMFRFHRTLDGVVMVYANLPRRPAIWMARDGRGNPITKRGLLPLDAQSLLKGPEPPTSP